MSSPGSFNKSMGSLHTYITCLSYFRARRKSLVCVCVGGVSYLCPSLFCAGHLESPDFLIYKMNIWVHLYLSLIVLMQQNTSGRVI